MKVAGVGEQEREDRGRSPGELYLGIHHVINGMYVKMMLQGAWDKHRTHLQSGYRLLSEKGNRQGDAVPWPLAIVTLAEFSRCSFLTLPQGVCRNADHLEGMPGSKCSAGGEQA